MTAHRLFETVRRMSTIINEVEAAGMRVEISSDFTLYRRLRLEQADRNAPFPMFDTASSFVDHTNAFWVMGLSPEGELVHTQAIRLFDLGEMTLEQHLADHRHKYITPGSTPNLDRTFFTRLTSLKAITGRVCYHGEFWLKGGNGGHRSQGFTALLSRMVFEVAHTAWDPDFLFGFVPTPLAMKGIGIRYGYTHCEQGAWVCQDNQQATEESLVWMNRDNLSEFMRSAPRSLSTNEQIPIRDSFGNRISAVA